MDNTLIHFLEVADTLGKSAAWRWLSKRKNPADMLAVFESGWSVCDGLQRGELMAFCADLMFLIGDDPRMSLRRVADVARTWPDAYRVERGGVLKAVIEVNGDLDETSALSVGTGAPASHREIFELIFHGGLARDQAAVCERFAALIDDGLFSHALFSAFCTTLFQYRTGIQAIAYYVSRRTRPPQSVAGV